MNKYGVSAVIREVGEALVNTFPHTKSLRTPDPLSCCTFVQQIDTVELFSFRRHRKLSLRFLASYLLGINIQVRGWRRGGGEKGRPQGSTHRGWGGLLIVCIGWGITALRGGGAQ